MPFMFAMDPAMDDDVIFVARDGGFRSVAQQASRNGDAQPRVDPYHHA